MRVGIDTSNIGGGGGVTHLIEILENFDIDYFKSDISKIIIFSSSRVLDKLPNNKFIEKVSFPHLDQGLLKRVYFQLTKYDE